MKNKDTPQSPIYKFPTLVVSTAFSGIGGFKYKNLALKCVITIEITAIARTKSK